MGDGTTYMSKRNIASGVFAFVCVASLNIYLGGGVPVGQLEEETLPSYLTKKYVEGDDYYDGEFKSKVEGNTKNIEGDDDSYDDGEASKSKEEGKSKRDKEKGKNKNKNKKKDKKNKKLKGKESTHQLLKCEVDDTKDRWSNRPFNTSSIQSMFNCDREDSSCKYYYPANFFDKECGLGQEFAFHIGDAQAMKENGTLWNFMPSVGFPTITMNNTCLHLDSNRFVDQGNFMDKGSRISSSMVLSDIGTHDTADHRCYTERLSFLHVHKAGGSSLHNAFNFLSSSKNAALTRHKFFSPTHTPGKAVKASKGNAFMANLTLKSLSYASKYPDKVFDSEQHVIFAAVRDPTERFISAIGQALGAQGSSGNHIGSVLQKECVKDTSAKTLKCLAHYVQDHGFWIELHFTPQVLDISFTTMWQDAPIGIFSFTYLKDILHHFGRDNVHVRDGSKAQYRADPILTDMSIADYDEESLRIVCEIYEMDVRMQRSLGIEVPRCDPYIPHTFSFV